MVLWNPAADGVLTAIHILEPSQDPVRVSDEMPKTRPPQIILISQVDGSRPNPVQSIHRLLIELWVAKSLSVNIAQWCGQVSAQLCASSGRSFDGVFSYGWNNEQGPVDFPDPDVPDMRRWQFHGDLKLSAR